MSRNRYTKYVRKIERRQQARLEEELVGIARRLRTELMESALVLSINYDKLRRSTRLENNRCHRPHIANETVQKIA